MARLTHHYHSPWQSAVWRMCSGVLLAAALMSLLCFSVPVRMPVGHLRNVWLLGEGQQIVIRLSLLLQEERGDAYSPLPL